VSRHLPPAILAIGRNYAEHAKEMGGAVDPNPIIFMKNPASVIRDGDAIESPPICREHGPQVDFEGELAVEIGRDCRDVPEADALRVVRATADDGQTFVGLHVEDDETLERIVGAVEAFDAGAIDSDDEAGAAGMHD
jgi:hypothetical protein